MLAAARLGDGDLYSAVLKRAKAPLAEVWEGYRRLVGGLGLPVVRLSENMLKELDAEKEALESSVRERVANVLTIPEALLDIGTPIPQRAAAGTPAQQAAAGTPAQQGGVGTPTPQKAAAGTPAQ